MLNRSLLLSGEGSKAAKQYIGIPGEQGFGVGCYGGDPASLDAMGLRPLDGCGDPTSENYGNYIHTNGSVMVYIPAFVYRIGRSTAPSHSRDGANALEIKDALEMGLPTESMESGWSPGDGWTLHRAFIDGKTVQYGFFIDKYLCSKSASDRNIPVSVKNGRAISLSDSYEDSRSMTGCSGVLTDAVTLGRSRGNNYSLVTAFQWSALAMLSLAHGQAAESTQNCAWYDPYRRTNFPKGCNLNLKDENDQSVSFTENSTYTLTSTTGSGIPFAKTTHNGQPSGVTDVNGCMLQVVAGIYFASSWWPRPAIDEMRANRWRPPMINMAEVQMATDRVSERMTNAKWGAPEIGAFPTESTGELRACCGVHPSEGGCSEAGTDLFGTDMVRGGGSGFNYAPLVAGSHHDGVDAGIWYRNSNRRDWSYGDTDISFRIAGYAN